MVDRYSYEPIGQSMRILYFNLAYSLYYYTLANLALPLHIVLTGLLLREQVIYIKLTRMVAGMNLMAKEVLEAC